MKRSDESSQTLFLVLLVKFALLWTAFTLVFDYIMYVRDAMQQMRTTAFLAADAEVLSCSQKTEKQADGTSTVIDIAYKYQVDGQDYIGTKVRNLDFWSNLIATQFVADHPAGTPIIAYYEPRDPSVAVLEAGCDGRELFVPLLLLPFNVVMVGLWCVAVAGIRKGASGLDELWRGFRVFEAADELRFRLPSLSPAAAAVLVLCIVPWPVVFGTAWFVGVPKPVGVAVADWIIVLTCSVVAYGYIASRVSSGDYDVVIDQSAGTLHLPRRLTHGESILIHRGALVSAKPVALEGEEKRQHLVSLQWRDAGGNVVAVTLTTRLARDQAQNLIDWIYRNLGQPQTAR